MGKLIKRIKEKRQARKEVKPRFDEQRLVIELPKRKEYVDRYEPLSFVDPMYAIPEAEDFTSRIEAYDKAIIMAENQLKALEQQRALAIAEAENDGPIMTQDEMDYYKPYFKSRMIYTDPTLNFSYPGMTSEAVFGSPTDATYFYQPGSISNSAKDLHAKFDKLKKMYNVYKINQIAPKANPNYNSFLE